LAMGAGILKASEAVREIKPILQCSELGLGIGVVIRDIVGHGSWQHPDRPARRPLACLLAQARLKVRTVMLFGSD